MQVDRARPVIVIKRNRVVNRRGEGGTIASSHAIPGSAGGGKRAWQLLGSHEQVDVVHGPQRGIAVERAHVRHALEQRGLDSVDPENRQQVGQLTLPMERDGGALGVGRVKTAVASGETQGRQSV